MGSKRLPNEQTLEELLKTIEESQDESIVGVSDDVFIFISTFNILPGNNRILKRTMYALYRSWSKTPSSKQGFGRRMCEHFESTYSQGKEYYKINIDSFTVKKETLQLIESKKKERVKYPFWQNHFQSYLLFFGIKKGNVWIDSFVLYHIYQKWCYDNNRKTTLSKHEFHKFCKLYFKIKRNIQNNEIWFAVNKEFVDAFLPPEKLASLHQGRKFRNEKKQKIRNKTSGS